MNIHKFNAKPKTVPPKIIQINEIQTFLEKEVVTRESLSKKYFRAARIVDTVLIVITLGGEAGA